MLEIDQHQLVLIAVIISIYILSIVAEQGLSFRGDAYAIGICFDPVTMSAVISPGMCRRVVVSTNILKREDRIRLLRKNTPVETKNDVAPAMLPATKPTPKPPADFIFSQAPTVRAMWPLSS